MQILSWEYPAVRSFRDIVEKARLIPITALLSLNHTQKAQLLQTGIVLVKDLVTNSTMLSDLHLPKSREEDILHEAKQLIG
jgi:hypothetical protein